MQLIGSGDLVLGALGLGSAWMLMWGAAAAIPIVMHFLNQRRQKVVTWAAMRLLLQVVEQESRRLRIEQLLLLILRTLIPLLLAYALARPYLSDPDADSAAIADERPRLWIIAIDVSYSMGYQTGEQTRFADAKQQALRVVQESASGDAFALVALSSQPTKVISRPTFDREAMLAEIRRLELLDTGLWLSGGLQLIEEIAEDARRSPAVPQDVRGLLYSDLGSDSWQPATSGEVQAQIRRLTDTAALQIVSLAENAPPANVAVMALQAADSRPVVGRRLEVDVTVENFGSTAFARIPVQLKLNEQTVATEFLDLPAGARRSIRLDCLPKTTGPTVLSASVPSDRLKVDDQRLRVIDVVAENRVLVVEERERQSRALAVALKASAENTRRWQVETRTRLEVGLLDLHQWDAIVLDDLSRIDSSVHDRLLEFVQRGGALIAMFGQNTQPDLWNARASQTQSLTGFQLTQPSPEQLWDIDALDYKSPVVEPFQGFPDAGLLTTPVFRFWQMQPVADENLIVDLAVASGDPLIVRRRLGAGWVASLLSAPQSGNEGSTVAPSWNAMAAWPSFVPLMQRLVQSVLGSGVDQFNVLAGQPLVGRVAGTGSTSQVTIQYPKGLEETVLTDRVEPDGGLPWFYPRTQQAGVYLVQTQTDAPQPYAVNIDPVESNLVSLRLSQLAVPTAGSPARQPPVSETPRPEHGDQLARSILVVLGLLLATESLAAWWFGRRIG